MMQICHQCGPECYQHSMGVGTNKQGHCHASSPLGCMQIVLPNCMQIVLPTAHNADGVQCQCAALIAGCALSAWLFRQKDEPDEDEEMA
jgi:hypothetical protein